MASLDDFIFSRLYSLRTLDLSSNRITSLHEDVFDSLVNLQTLDLSDNELGGSAGSGAASRIADRPVPQMTTAYSSASADRHPVSFNSQISASIGSRPSFAGMSVDTPGMMSASDALFDGLWQVQSVQPAQSLMNLLSPDLFANLRNLRTLDLSGNNIESLDKDIFDDLPNIQSIDLSGNRLTSLPSDIFEGVPNLETLDLRDNQIRSLDASVFSGLSELRTLSLDDNTVNEREIRNLLPGLTTLQLDENEELAPPTILRIEPSIESVSIRTGSKVRLSINVFGLQDQQDDSLADVDAVALEWSSDGGGSFAESTLPGVEPNGEPDDRKVLHTVSDTPGTYTVTAKLASHECSGTDEQCSASIKIIATRSLEIAPSPTPVPCQISGTVPSAIADSEGIQYSVFTPAQGGTFTTDDSSAEITASINAVQGCEHIGIRIDKGGSAVNVNSALYRYTLAGNLYSVQAVDASGSPISDYRFNSAVQVCVPLPPALRGNITDIRVLKVSSDGTLTALTSKILARPNGSPSVCGALSQLPAEIAAGKRGAPDPTVVPMPTATPETMFPETGGRAVSYAWVLVIALLGAGVVMLGTATLRRRKG